MPREVDLSTTPSWDQFEIDNDQETRKSRTRDRDNLLALITALRWATVTMGLLIALTTHEDLGTLGLGVVLVAYSLWRTFLPIEYRRASWSNLISIVIELALITGVVVTTGCWNSPYVFVFLTPIITAGFARGFWHSIRIAATATLSVQLSSMILGLDASTRTIGGWVFEFLLIAIVASYGKRLASRAEQAASLNLSQLWKLGEANALLKGLNRLSHNLPVSFDYQETLRSTLANVRETTQPDVIALLLLDPISPNWNVAIVEGARLPEIISDENLPNAVRTAAHARIPALIRDLSETKPGLGESSTVGIYLPLWAGTRQVGLIAVEANNNDRLGDHQLQLLHELTETTALTIDNARWFERLRARGAAQERTRIARDLHDRIGQDIAYVAFELDRLSGKAAGTELENELEDLRTNARAMVKELRETLYDLRADVSDDQGLIETINEFLGRVSARSDLHSEFKSRASRRLPLSQEREVWRICQEAVVNAERHAEARNIWVYWEIDEEGCLLMIRDDGIGIHSESDSGTSAVAGYGQSQSPGRPSYGMTGMRERADVIGALLETESKSGEGTTIRLKLGNRRQLNV